MSLILSTAEDVQCAVKSNLSTAEAHIISITADIQYGMSSWKRAPLNFLLHQLKTIRSLWWAVKISSLRKVEEISDL